MRSLHPSSRQTTGRRIVALLALVSAIGCAVRLDAPPHDAGVVHLTDRRAADDRRSYRPDGFFAPIIQIGDDQLSPPASTLLAAWVQKAKPADRGSVALVVDRLRVLDSFPRRHRAGMSAAMAGSLVGAGLPPMVFASAPAGTDAIIVWASGSIDGVPFEASAAVPYREPMLTVALRETPEFQGAMSSAFQQVADEIWAHTQTALRP